MRDVNQTGATIKMDAIIVDGDLYLKQTDVVNWIKQQTKLMEGQDIEVLHHLVKALIVATNKIKTNGDGTNY